MVYIGSPHRAQRSRAGGDNGRIEPAAAIAQQDGESSVIGADDNVGNAVPIKITHRDIERVSNTSRVFNTALENTVAVSNINIGGVVHEIGFHQVKFSVAVEVTGRDYLGKPRAAHACRQIESPIAFAQRNAKPTVIRVGRH